MQNLREEPYDYRPTFKDILEMSRFMWRYPKHPEALEPFLASYKGKGIPETNITNVRTMLLVWRQTYLDRMTPYRIDSYLTTGMGAVDLILLTVVLPLGVPDRLLFIALLTLAISLVLVGSSLFISFVKRDLKIGGYGKIHSTVIFCSLLSGTAALTATFWHFSVLIGVVFLALAAIAYVICALYAALARVGLGFIQQLAATAAERSADTNEP